LSAISLSLDSFNPGVTTERRNPIPFNGAGSGDFACQPGDCAINKPNITIPATGESYSYCGATYFGQDFALSIAATTNCIEEYCGPLCPISDSNSIMTRFHESGASAVGVEGLTYIKDVSILLLCDVTTTASCLLNLILARQTDVQEPLRHILLFPCISVRSNPFHARRKIW
jgi:hypothetical protein